MKKISILAFTLLLVIVFSSCTSSNTDKNESNKSGKDQTEVKNIILLIGDGMGTAHFYAGMGAAEQRFTVEEFKNIGFQKTYSANDFITGSAASGTAMATGYKTNNGYIGMLPNGEAVPSILEMAEKHGYATGLVSTSTIVHATPAAFIAHNGSRNNYEEIAADFLKTDIDVFIGGGSEYFNQREDGRNLTDSLEDRGYIVSYSMDEIRTIDEGKLAGLTAEGHNPKYSEGRGDMLPEATQTAIRILNNNEKGFFLMVEGSQVDWGGHDQSIEYILEETKDFDNAVKQAKKFADDNQNTLVIVTSDHECGGMTLTGGNIEKGEVEAHFSSDGHTGVMVPVFAYGPGAEKFQGIYENTDVFKKMKSLYGF